MQRFCIPFFLTIFSINLLVSGRHLFAVSMHLRISVHFTLSNPVDTLIFRFVLLEQLSTKAEKPSLHYQLTSRYGENSQIKNNSKHIFVNSNTTNLTKIRTLLVYFSFRTGKDFSSLTCFQPFLLIKKMTCSGTSLYSAILMFDIQFKCCRFLSSYRSLNSQPFVRLS